jgi:dihydrolipoamide dehydrogenase
VVVVGGGPGGYTAAIRAAQLGKKTAIVEKDKLGGLCLNWGCIPSKALIRSAEIYHLINDAESFGLSVENVKVNFDKVVQRSRGIADKLNKGVEFLMKKNKITVFKGTADLSQKNKVTITSADDKKQEIEAAHVIIATGGKPRSLPGIEFDHKTIINSSDAMVLPKIPKSMVIIGGGPIGVEFAYVYRAFGTEITIVEMLPQILPLEDDEITRMLAMQFKKQGIKLETGAKVTAVKKSAKGVEVEIETKSGKKTLSGDLALVAVGFSGNTENLGLEKLGIADEKSFIKVDKMCRTNVPNYYAIGDVIGAPLLAHVASAEAVMVAEHIAGMNPEPVDYGNIPGCTYCHPQVASIGMTEKAAKEAGYEIKVGKFPFQALGKAIATGDTNGLVKLIFDAKYGELLGAHIIGAEATDLIAELGLARSHEATGHSIIKTVHAHPTLSEAVMEAAADAYGEAINF